MSITSKVESAARSVKDAVTPDAGNDILATLKSEHDEVKQLLSQLEDATEASERRSLVAQIKAALVPHTEAEQVVLYDAIIERGDKDAQVDGHEGYVEHQRAADTLKELEGIADATSAEHIATAKVLKELVTHHIKEEESNVWDDAKESFSKEDRAAMNQQYEEAKAGIHP